MKKLEWQDYLTVILTIVAVIACTVMLLDFFRRRRFYDLCEASPCAGVENRAVPVDPGAEPDRSRREQ
jgi:hypothetical protein